jgi:23S rRNA (cytidine2498-2'-O)-methyltransferase
LRVDAVDPGDLDSRVCDDPAVTHVRQRIQDFLPGARQYDVIVNDLKMDARASIAIMLQAERHLGPGGLAVMTLKMPRMGRSAKESRRALAMVRADLQSLSRGFVIKGARQLYHNRSEVTVALQSRG